MRLNFWAKRENEEPSHEKRYKEETLTNAARSGDPVAFEKLVRECGKSLVTWCHANLRDISHTEDVIVIAQIKAHKAVAQFHGTNQRAFCGWFKKILIRTCIDFNKNPQMAFEAAMKELDATSPAGHRLYDPPDTALPPGEADPTCELPEALKNGVANRLADRNATPIDYEIFIWRYEMELTWPEISAKCGLTSEESQKRHEKKIKPSVEETYLELAFQQKCTDWRRADYTMCWRRIVDGSDYIQVAHLLNWPHPETREKELQERWRDGIAQALAAVQFTDLALRRAGREWDQNDAILTDLRLNAGCEYPAAAECILASAAPTANVPVLVCESHVDELRTRWHTKIKPVVQSTIVALGKVERQ